MSQMIPESTAAAAASNAKEDDLEFVPEEVSEMAISIIEKVLGENPYSELKVKNWTTNITERLLTELSKLKRPFKYVVLCTLQQRMGAGFVVSSCSHWEPTVDGSCSIKWNNEYIFCFVHVFGVQI